MKENSTFNTNYVELLEYFKTDHDVLDIIKTDIAHLQEYVQAVYSMETLIPIYRVRYDDDDLRYHIEKLDNARRDKHNLAIMSVKRLNRFADLAKLPRLFDGNVDDRYEVADFCMNTVNTVFSTRSL